MTWDAFQDLHLKIAREVGAEQNLRAELIAPEELHPEPFDARPRMFSLRYLYALDDAEMRSALEPRIRSMLMI